MGDGYTNEEFLQLLPEIMRQHDEKRKRQGKRGPTTPIFVNEYGQVVQDPGPSPPRLPGQKVVPVWRRDRYGSHNSQNETVDAKSATENALASINALRREAADTARTRSKGWWGDLQGFKESDGVSPTTLRSLAKLDMSKYDPSKPYVPVPFSVGESFDPGRAKRHAEAEARIDLALAKKKVITHGPHPRSSSRSSSQSRSASKGQHSSRGRIPYEPRPPSPRKISPKTSKPGLFSRFFNIFSRSKRPNHLPHVPLANGKKEGYLKRVRNMFSKTISRLRGKATSGGTRRNRHRYE